MTITSGIVDTGTAALNCDAIMDAIGAAIAAHASWDFVEEVTAVTAGRRTKVYHNPTEGIYYALIKASTAAPSFGCFLFEGYNGATKQATKFVPNNSNTPYVSNSADESYVGAKHVADDTRHVNDTLGHIWTRGPDNAAATATAWRCSVSPDTIIVSNAGANNMVFAGKLITPPGTLWRAPWGYGAPQTAMGFFALNRAARGQTSMYGIPSTPGASNGWMAAVSKDLNLNAYVYSPIPILSQVGNAYFGTLKDVIYFDNTQVAAVPGDTVTLDGEEYMMFSTDLWVRTAA